MYLTGFEPLVPVRLSSRVRRMTANNPGVMTASGTNTYILGQENCVVIDPGPLDQPHIDAILQVTNHSIGTICVTHTHPDHSPGAALLAERTGARLIGAVICNDGHQDETFTVHESVSDGQWIEADGFRLQAIHTPGHVSNHFCYLLHEEGLLFTGDHIMEGSTVVIIPPGGDMADYIASLKRLKSLKLKSLAPGHGAVVENPDEWIDWLIQHRLQREQKVVNKLALLGQSSLNRLTAVVYDDVDVSLHPIAQISLWAHLIKLEKEGRAEKYSEKHWLFGEDNWKLL